MQAALRAGLRLRTSSLLPAPLILAQNEAARFVPLGWPVRRSEPPFSGTHFLGVWTYCGVSVMGSTESPVRAPLNRETSRIWGREEREGTDNQKASFPRGSNYTGGFWSFACWGDEWGGDEDCFSILGWRRGVEGAFKPRRFGSVNVEDQTNAKISSPFLEVDPFWRPSEAADPAHSQSISLWSLIVNRMRTIWQWRRQQAVA